MTSRNKPKSKKNLSSRQHASSKGKRTGAAGKQTDKKNRQSAPHSTGRDMPLLRTRVLKPLHEGLIILLLAIAGYVNTIGHDFVLDDMLMITHNKFTLQGVSGIGDIMFNDAFTGFHGENKNLLPGGRYRPLAQVMFALEYELFGDNPMPGHLVNILLYAVTCFLLYKMLLLLFRRFNYNLVPFSLAFIVTALFTIHPLHTESVANIKGRDEIMSLLGLVVMALFALRYAEKREKRWLWLIAPVYLLTLLSKENALTYILAVPLMLLFAGTTNRKVYLHTVVAMAAGLVGYLFFRFAAIPPGSTSDVKMTELLNDPFLYATGSERLATVIYTWGRYLWLIIFPFTLTHDYYPWHIEYRSLGDPVVMLLVVMLLVLLVYALRKIRKPDFVAFGILFFIVVFSIQSNLIINIGSFMNERFVFVALLGFMIILGWLLVKVLPKYTSKQLALLVFVLFMIFFSIRTVTRNSVWASDFVLFTSDVEVSERSAKCNVSAGGQLYDSAMRVENEHIRNDLINRAIFFLNRGVELHPAYMQGRIMYGNALLQMNRFDESIAQYMACLKMNPGMKDVLTNINALGLKAIAKKEYPNAVTAFEVLKKTDPGDVDYAINYVEAVMNTGNTSVAEKILDSLYTIHPENAHLNHLLGQLYGRFIPSRPAISEHEQRALYSKSREFLERAVALDSSNYSMRENLAIIYGILGQYDKSVRFFQRAINIVKASEKEVEATAAVKKRYRENYYRLYRNLGDTYSNQGNISKAIDAYYTALENRPLDSHVTRSLARLIAMTGKVTESIALLEEYIRNNPNDQNAIQLMEQIKQLP